jgi:hypothetical protein
MREERKKVWIDAIQTKLFVRIGMYWLIYTVALWNLLFIWRLLSEGPGDPLEQYGRFFLDYWPALVCFVVVVPALAWDAVRFTHRLVGPIYRFRKTIQALSNGEAVQPLKLRDDDFLKDMRDDFNRMLDTLQRQGAPVLKPANPDAADERTQQRA